MKATRVRTMVTVFQTLNRIPITVTVRRDFLGLTVKVCRSKTKYNGKPDLPYIFFKTTYGLTASPHSLTPWQHFKSSSVLFHNYQCIILTLIFIRIFIYIFYNTSCIFITTLYVGRFISSEVSSSVSLSSHFVLYYKFYKYHIHWLM